MSVLYSTQASKKVACPFRPKMMKMLKRKQMRWFLMVLKRWNLQKSTLKKHEREQKLLLDDIRELSLWCDLSGDLHQEKESDLWMITGGRSMLIQGLKRELVNAQKSRKAASVSLRMALQKAAQLRLTEKEKNKSPSYAMPISLQINKWFGACLLMKSDASSRCTTRSSKGWKFSLELFQVEIYPLKIHLTETMYRMMWEYFFPEEEQDSQRRQEVWKVSTTAGARRVKKGSSLLEASASSSHSIKEPETSSKSGISAMLFPVTSQPSVHVDSSQASKAQNVKANPGTGTTPELRRTSSFDRTWEETVAESVANELVLQSFSSSKNGSFGSAEQQDEASKSKSKDSKVVKGGRSSHEEKKVAKSHEEKRSRPRKMMEFHNIKISQVELLVTYEGQRIVVNDLKLLMDQFHRAEFTGTWRRLFSRVKKHIIWGVLKSVTGMQGRKFKDKGQSQPTGAGVPEIDLNFSDNEGQAGKSDQYPPSWPKRPGDGAGDGFVTSIRGLFNTQRRKAKAFVLRTMRGEAENDFQGDWSESDVEFSPFARQLTITKAKKLIRRHTKKFRSRGQKGSSSQQRESLPSSPRETTPFDSDSSSGSSPYEDFHE
ncbi:FMP27, C-terminal [Sesbania bispinosa]|nr:FMP27, C-terminal [Sesbania bispinosa]